MFRLLTLNETINTFLFRSIILLLFSFCSLLFVPVSLFLSFFELFKHFLVFDLSYYDFDIFLVCFKNCPRIIKCTFNSSGSNSNQYFVQFPIFKHNLHYFQNIHFNKFNIPVDGNK